MRTFRILFLTMGCFSFLALTADSAFAQKGKKEICDNGIDDDGDKDVDCDDKDCAGSSKCKKGGEPCSPGYWKNHPEEWTQCCGGEGQPSCSEIDEALRDKGPGSSVTRAAAASYLEDCAGQPCNDTIANSETMSVAAATVSQVFGATTLAPAAPYAERGEHSAELGQLFLVLQFVQGALAE